jgi:hypothetical protein
MSDQRMIDTQAKHITRLNNELMIAGRNNAALERRIENLTSAHDYYMAIQKAVLADEACMEAWQAFLVMLALTQNKPIPGLTCEEPKPPHDPSAEYFQYSLAFGA